MMEEQMNCNDIYGLLTAYLDGEVTPEEKAYIETHLPGCPQCRAELKALSATQDNLSGVLRSRAEEASPSPQAWESLREKLDTKDNWLGKALKRLIPRSMVWRLATTTALVIVLAFAGSVWFFGGMGSPPPPVPSEAPAPILPAPMPRPVEFIETKAETSRSVYTPGEDIIVTFSFKNVSQKVFKIDPFPPDIEITHYVFGTSGLVRLFPAGDEIRVLEPEEIASYTITWDQRNESRQQVDYDYYNFKTPDIGTQDELFRSVGGVYIHPPEGVIEEVIEVDQTQTVNGITFTLKRVEFTASGLSFYVFNADSQKPVQPPETNIGEYSLDGGPVIEEGSVRGVSWRSNVDGYCYSWEMSRPVPKGTRELNFVITSFGEWEGPWEFTIFLE
jgi:hypothetical protein